MFIFLTFLAIFGFPSEALKLPKIYKNGMVLQADPTEAIIWGFLEGNSNQVSIEGTCHFNDKKINIFKVAQILEVRYFSLSKSIYKHLKKDG